MAAEEFQESEVIFPDHDHDHDRYQVMDRENSRVLSNNNTSRRGKKNKKKKTSTTSIPVNIPSRMFELSSPDEFEEENYDDEELIPPHVIVGRRIEGKMAFSVCTGNGRTLKGRDLSQVRNSILRLTGFLET